MNTDIYQYVKSKESEFETEKIRVGRNWQWSFKDQTQMIFHLKNGQFFTGDNDYLRAFKNVMLPMLNLAYWVQDIDLKDGAFWVEGTEDRVLSFLVKKYHDEVYAREHDLDELIDDITESDVDLGGVLVRPTNGERPEVIPLVRIAFCDQVSVTSGAVGFRYDFSPDKLRAMSEKGWGERKNGATIDIEELITLAETSKTPNSTLGDKANNTPSKSIEVYIVHGSLPEAYLKDNDNMEKWYDQLQVIGFYTDKDGKRNGVTLYRAKAFEESKLLFHTSNKIEGRALGLGEGERLIHPQIWTNFTEIHKMALIEASSKTVLWSDDTTITNRNTVQDMDNLEVLRLEQGTQIGRVPTAAPDNIQILQNSADQWLAQAQLVTSAQDPMLGKEAVSGTTFKGQERTVAQGRGYHDRQRGKRAKFIEKIYREIIIPDIISEIVGGKKFLASLTSDEMLWVSNQLAENEASKRYKESLFKVARGKSKMIMTQEELDSFKASYKEMFRKKTGKHLIEILKDEFKGFEDRIGISFANKQKDLSMLSDKVLSVFQYIFANPAAFQQAMQIPALAKSFQSIMEFSGINVADFQSLLSAPPLTQAPEQVQQPAQQPMMPQQ